ncbi:MAG: hypothetical protein RMJ98_21960 [Myxococcales bacterium]|nr:hypothetical protein [Myxococcales bacterium]
MRLAWSLVLVPALCSAAPVLGAPTEAEIKAARKLFEQAQAHEAEGHWLDALALLERILLVKETAGIRFHIALCQERLGQLLAAESNYRRSAELAEQMKSPEGTAIVEQAGAALAALKPRIPLLTLRFSQDIPGLRVEIDGVLLKEEQLRQPIPRNPGSCVVRVSAPEYEEFTQQIVLTERASHLLDIVLTRPAAAASVSSLPLPASSPVPAAAPRAFRYPHWSAYTVGGVALMAAGGSLFLYLQHQRLRQETEDICNDPRYLCDRTGREAKISSYRTYGLIAGGTALVGLAAGVYLLLARSPEPTGTALVVGPGTVGVAGSW